MSPLTRCVNWISESRPDLGDLSGTLSVRKTGDYSPVFGFKSWLIADSLVNVELLLMHAGIAFYDDGPLGHLFHFVQQFGIVGLEFFGDIRMHAQHDVFVLQMLGDLAHLHVDLVADGNRLVTSTVHVSRDWLGRANHQSAA